MTGSKLKCWVGNLQGACASPIARVRILHAFTAGRLRGFDLYVLTEVRCSSEEQAAAWEEEARDKGLEAKFSAGCNVGFYWKQGDGRLIADGGEFTAVRRGVGTIVDDISPWKGRAMAIRLVLPRGTLTVVGVYAPNVPGHRKLLFRRLTDILGSQEAGQGWRGGLEEEEPGVEHRVMLAGDWNCIEDPVLDQEPPAPETNRIPDDVDALMNLSAALGVADLYRAFHPHGKDVTNTSAGAARRLDRVYVGAGLREDALEVKVGAKIHGSHSPIHFAIRADSKPKVKSEWYKVPRDFFDVPHRAANAGEVASRARKEAEACGDDVRLNYSHVLRQVRSYARAVGRSLAAFDRRHGTSDANAQWRSRCIRARVIQAETTRLQLDWRLTTARAESAIDEIIVDGGTIVNEPAEVREEVARFYQNLLTEPELDPAMMAQVVDWIEQTIPADLVQKMERPYTIEEIGLTVQRAAEATSPGPNGLPLGFWKACWAEVGALVTAVKNQSCVDGVMADGFRQRYISLIPKKGDARELTNKRPISLLNVDARFLAKADVERMKAAMLTIVGEEQVGFMPGRWIGTNIADIQAVFESKSASGWLLNTDQVKAYDRVHHDYLDRVLEATGFGPRMRNALRAQYRGGKARVMVNGTLTRELEVSCGVPQGSPVACFLYNLTLEPLLTRIRKRVRGIHVPDRLPPRPPATAVGRAVDWDEGAPALEAGLGSAPPPAERQTRMKVRAFADDMIMGVGDVGDWTRLSRAIRSFERGTGATISQQKSFIVPLGWMRKENRLPPDCAYPVLTDNFRYLGVDVGYEDTDEQKWDELISTMERKAKRFTLTGLPLHIKARLINSRVMAKAVYQLTFLRFPTKQQLKRIRAMQLDALYRGEHRKFSATNGYPWLPRDKGGLGLIDVKRDMMPLLVRWWWQVLCAPFGKADDLRGQVPLHIVALRSRMLAAGRGKPPEQHRWEWDRPLYLSDRGAKQRRASEIGIAWQHRSWLNVAVPIGMFASRGTDPWPGLGSVWNVQCRLSPRWEERRQLFNEWTERKPQDSLKMRTVRHIPTIAERLRWARGWRDALRVRDPDDVLCPAPEWWTGPGGASLLKFFEESAAQQESARLTEVREPRRWESLQPKIMWGPFWDSLKKVPEVLGRESQTLFLLAVGAWILGPERLAYAAPNRGPECILCGEEEDGLEHVLVRCSKAREVVRRATAGTRWQRAGAVVPSIHKLFEFGKWSDNDWLLKLCATHVLVRQSRKRRYSRQRVPDVTEREVDEMAAQLRISLLLGREVIRARVGAVALRGRRGF